jgi:hypothetical protein
MSNTEKLTVTRRRSKQRQEVPVIPVDGYFKRLPRETDHPVFVVTPKS